MSKNGTTNSTKRKHLSGYRLMWMIVMFDLPVGSKQERKAASDFRHFLLDEGFHMAQYSVYYRVMPGKEYIEKYLRGIKSHLPSYGNVNILSITDKQYENLISFNGRKKEPHSTAPKQLTLF